MKTAYIALGLITLLASGCGSASKEDICGSCSDVLKTACETTYDACNDDGDCLDALEDTNICG